MASNVLVTYPRLKTKRRPLRSWATCGRFGVSRRPPYLVSAVQLVKCCHEVPYIYISLSIVFIVCFWGHFFDTSYGMCRTWEAIWSQNVWIGQCPTISAISWTLDDFVITLISWLATRSSFLFSLGWLKRNMSLWTCSSFEDMVGLMQQFLRFSVKGLAI